MRRVGWFQLVMGCGIVGVWTLLLVTGQVLEVDEGRIDSWFHLTAELATGAALVVAGVLILQRTPRASLAACVALGALAYTAVNSAGYYDQAGEWMPVVLFGVAAISTGLAAAHTFRSMSSVPRSGRSIHGDAPTVTAPAGHGPGLPTQGDRR